LAPKEGIAIPPADYRRKEEVKELAPVGKGARFGLVSRNEWLMRLKEFGPIGRWNFPALRNAL
jgi:hypothetical protein